MDDATRLKLDTIRDFLGWLTTEPHGHGAEVVGLWKGADATGMTNWSPDPTALAYDYLGIDPQTGEPIRL